MNPARTALARTLNKVPEVTAVFWVIKILSTTVGETGADFLAVDAGLGQPVTRSLMAGWLLFVLMLQFARRRYTPWLYWLSVVLVSVVGTQLTDFLTDDLKVPLAVSTAAFSVLLAAVFAGWWSSEHTLSIQSIDTGRREAFYWVTVLLAFALGTAAGDLATEALGIGFLGGALAFGAAILLSVIAWRLGASTVLVFWLAYVLTRPFGAALGDWLTQGKDAGGLGFGAMWTSALFLTVIAILVGMAQWESQRADAVAGR